MTYDPRIHNRRSMRLQGYDYSQPGAYFVTMVVQHRESRFGAIVGGAMILNDAGKMVHAEWQRLPTRFATMELDAFVVMPNHFHAIMWIVEPNNASVGAGHIGAGHVGAGLVPVQTNSRAGTSPADRKRAGTSPAPTDKAIARPTLSDMIGAFKSITTDEYIRGVKESGWPRFDRRVWQRNYYDHIIRNDRELNAIRRYIRNNPARWELDRDNPMQQATSQETM